MKLDAKKGYYIAIIILGIVSIFVTLFTLGSRNKYPSESSLRNTLNLFTIQLYKNFSQSNLSYDKYIKNLFKKKSSVEEITSNFNIKQNLTNYVFPFSIAYKIDSANSDKFLFKYSDVKNELTFYNIDKLSEKEFNESYYPGFLSKFALNLNYSQDINETLDNIQERIRVFRGVNIYIWIKHSELENEINYFNKNYKQKVIATFKNLQNIGPITIKYIYYQNFEGSSLYSQIKRLNPKRLIDEINDKELFNIHLINSKEDNKDINTYLNSDLQTIIFSLNYNNSININLYNYITLTLSLQSYFYNTFSTETLQYNYLNECNLIEMTKIFNSPNIQKYLKFMAIIKNSVRISRIFSVYESILTINKVKTKINKLNKFFNILVKKHFVNYNTIEIEKDIDEIYIDTLYLLYSNELVIFEHFFSTEFKIGQFLPITLPMLYAILKSIKAFTV